MQSNLTFKDPAMDVLADNDKVRKTSSMAALEVSASFSRIGNELFACEKQSNFSPNKYLEEVEKCSTAGSVAQKKAYFEAHYQKITTQKTEPLEQDKQNKNTPSRSDHQTGAADLLISKTLEANPGNREEAKQETTLIDDISEKDVECVMECKKKEFEKILDCLEMKNKPRESDLIEEFEETHSIESKNIKEQPKSPIIEKSNKAKTIEKAVKSYREIAAEKIAPSKKEKKQQISSIAKPHQPMNSKTMKATLSPITPPASQLSVKANHNSSLLRSRNHSSVENKKLGPKFMNMSLNLGSYGSHHPSSAALSKSFIMEKTEDKDSAKLAFKTCHHNFSQLNSSAEDRSASKKVSAKGTEPRIAASLTTRKENRGAETFRNLKAPNPVSSLRFCSDEQTKKTKELLKRVEEKTKPREGERRSLQSKSKAEQVEGEAKNLRKSPNFRAAPAKVFPMTKTVK